MKWKIAFVCLICVTCLTNAKKAVIHGKISFSGKKLTTIPEKSCLVVKIEDTRIADAPSTTIAKRIVKKQDLKLTAGSLFYNITFQQPEDSTECTLGATLNMGWCPSGGGDWLHGGDFLTTTMFNFEAKPEIHLYEKDIELEYNHDRTHRHEDPCHNAPCYNSICISYPNGTYFCKKLETLPCAIPMCADIYQPVCGSNRKTYPNECVMFGDSCNHGVQTDLYKLHDGECFSSSKHGLHSGLLLAALMLTLATLGLVAIFFVWRNNRRLKLQKMSQYDMKKVAPLDL